MSKGLTLIESLIGMTLVSFGVFFVILVFPLIMRSTLSSEKETVALFLATAKIEEVVAESYSLIEETNLVEDYGDIDNYDDYKRELVVSCFHPERNCENEETGMKKIKVIVLHKNNNRELISLTSLVSKR